MLLFLTDVSDPFLALDGAGAPLASATLQFYRSGTTAPQPVYSDSGLTMAISQPITSDADGVFPTIYLDPDLTYRSVLKTATGRLVWDVDPYEIDDSVAGRNLMRTPRVHALDANGIPIPGEIYFYTAGTGVKKDTFADGARETPHPNPIKADAGGFFRPIYLALTGSYDVSTTWIPPGAEGDVLLFGALESGVAALTWTEAENASSYQLYRNEDGGEFSLIATTLIGNPREHDDDTIENGPVYQYYVIPVWGTEAGNQSNVIEISQQGGDIVAFNLTTSQGSQVLISSDGGETWQFQAGLDMAGQSISGYYYAPELGSGQGRIGIGTSNAIANNIWYTDDAGVTWARGTSPTTRWAMPNAAYVADFGVVTTIGRGAGGTAFRPLYSADGIDFLTGPNDSNLLSHSLLDAWDVHGIVQTFGGGQNDVMRTSDGINWTRINFTDDGDVDLNTQDPKIGRINPTTGRVIASANGTSAPTLVRSDTLENNSWTDITLPGGKNNYQAVYNPDDDEWLAADRDSSMAGNVYKSTDDGDTWQDTGTAIAFSDGLIWSRVWQRYVGARSDIGGSTFVRIYTSADGVTWDGHTISINNTDIRQMIEIFAQSVTDLGPWPTPVLSSYSPTPIVQYFTGTVTLTGELFAGVAVVKVDGVDRSTTWVSDTELTFELEAADTDEPATLSITVEQGAAESDPLSLEIVAAWTPAEITTELWFDFSDAATITVATGITQVTDKSGNDRTLTQGSASAQPEYVTNGINSRDIARFDGSADYLEGTTNLAGLATSQPSLSAFVLRKHATSASSARRLLAVSGGAAGVTRITVEAGRTSGRNCLGGRRLDSDSFDTVAASGAMNTDWGLQCALFDWASSDLLQYIDGTLDGSNTSFQTDGNSDSANPVIIRLGMSQASAVELFNGDMAEVVALHSDDDSTRQLIEGYVLWKWGLQANLPAGHPYEDMPPAA